MKYLLIVLLALTGTAVASPQPVTGPGDLIDSCLKYGLFVMAKTNPATGEVVYGTFACNHMFDSLVPPVDKRAPAGAAGDFMRKESK